MGREIKFRVWEKGTNRLLGYEYFNTCLNNGFMYTNLSELKDGEDEGDLICHSEFHDPPMLKPKNFNQLFREEYANLKDKNGKEIYEGDIFKHSLNNKKWIVSNDGLGFTISNTKSPKEDYEIMYLGEALHIWKDHKIELTLLGNIHENPELCRQS